VGVGFEIRRCAPGALAPKRSVIYDNYFVGSAEGVFIRECGAGHNKFKGGVKLDSNIISSGEAAVTTSEARGVGDGAGGVLITNNEIDLQANSMGRIGTTGILWTAGSSGLTITGNTIRGFDFAPINAAEPAPLCGIEIQAGVTPQPATALLENGNTILITKTDVEAEKVCGGNVAPVANFSFNCRNSLTCDFQSLSSDAGGTIASYGWSFGDGSPVATAANPTKTYTNPGTYSVQLTVTDNQGLTSSITKSVEAIRPPNAAPVASFTFTCTGRSCTFTNTSTDADGIASSVWTYGDGKTSLALPTTPHVYQYQVITSQSTYAAKVAVTDRNPVDAKTGTSPEQHVRPIAATATANPSTGGRRSANVKWTGYLATPTDRVLVYRNNALIGNLLFSAASTGFTDGDAQKRNTYRVCRQPTPTTATPTICSENVNVNF
jgi:hypothetical protein